MTFEQLLYAEVLSHHPTLQAAADILHISKSGLSLAIAQLEDELGIQLFERTSRGTFLTPAGLPILSSISEVLHAKNTLMNTIALASDLRRHETVSIRYMNTPLKPFINAYLGPFQKAYAHTQLDIRCSEQSAILELVRNKKIDAGFIVRPLMLSELGEQLAFEQVFHANLVLVCSSESPLLLKKEITLDDLKEQKFCLFHDESHDYVFNQLQYMCGPLRLIFQTDDGWTMHEAVRKLNAVCFGRTVQGKLLGETAFDDLKTIPISHLVDSNVSVGWVTNTQRTLPEPAKYLIKAITEQIKMDAAEAASTDKPKDNQ